MICVTGGGGMVGSQVLAQLRDRDVPVRALVRSAVARGAAERQQVAPVEGDLDAPETLPAAFDGCDRLFLLSPPHPAQQDREIAAIDAAKEAGVAHVVALSILGADPASSVPFARWHSAVDRHLMDSGLGYTILRPAGFMQVHLWPVATVRTERRWYGMTGDGVAGFIDAVDIGAVAAEVLSAPGHAGAVYELTGPAALSMPEAARTLAEVIGSDVDYVDVAPEAFTAQLTAAGLPDFIAAAITAAYRDIRAGHAATVTNSVENVLGRPPRSYREFAELHRASIAAA